LLLLSENLKELARAKLLPHLDDHLFDTSRELVQIFKCLYCEVKRRRLVVLDALQVAYDVLCMLFLLINYTLQVVVLLINLGHNFLLESDLARNPPLHARALLLVLTACIEDLIELSHLLLCCHLKGFDLVGLVGEGAVEAKDHVARGTESLELLVLAKGYACRLLPGKATPTPSFHL
jgi:hypothetical protein